MNQLPRPVTTGNYSRIESALSVAERGGTSSIRFHDCSNNANMTILRDLKEMVVRIFIAVFICPLCRCLSLALESWPHGEDIFFIVLLIRDTTALRRHFFQVKQKNDRLVQLTKLTYHRVGSALIQVFKQMACILS